MTGQIYNIAATAASAIAMNPLIPAVVIVAILAIATGLAGRLALWYEDLRYTMVFGQNR